MRTAKTSAIALSLFLGLSATAFAQTTTPGAETTNPSETENNAGTIEQITPGNQAPGTTDSSTMGTTGATGATGATTEAVPENTNPSESEQGTGMQEELTRGCPEGQKRASVGAECMMQ